MNRSIRDTKPTKIFNLSHRVDCVAFNSKNQQIVLSFNYLLLCYDQDTLKIQQRFRLDKIMSSFRFKISTFYQ